MASKDELLKQHRTLARRPRTNAPSYTMDIDGELKQEATTSVIPTKVEEKAAEVKEDLLINNTPEKILEETTQKTENLVEQEKPSQNKTDLSHSKKKESAKEDIVKSVTVRLVDIDDADYLKYACKAKGMNMQEFFWSIIETDIKSSKKIDPRDAEHIEFKSISLPEIRTIPIPKSLKEKIGVQSGLHRLPETRYMAMVVHRSRLSNPAWS